MDKDLMNQNWTGLLQSIRNGIPEGLTRIMSEHPKEVKYEALAERVPSLGRSFGMSDSMYIFPSSTVHLCLDVFFPWLPSFVGEEISVELECLSPSMVTVSFAALMAFRAFL